MRKEVAQNIVIYSYWNHAPEKPKKYRELLKPRGLTILIVKPIAFLYNSKHYLKNIIAQTILF